MLEQQSEYRAQLEREPVRFFVRELEPLLDAAREELAEFLGADPAGLAFVPNATAGVNAVLRSLDLDKFDELLVTTQEYNACRNTLDYVDRQSPARRWSSPTSPSRFARRTSSSSACWRKSPTARGCCSSTTSPARRR